jgi:septum site-determining protein MinD
VLRASNLGSPVTVNEPANVAARAYTEAARRLDGDHIPMVLPTDKRGLLDRLLGRRAA